MIDDRPLTEADLATLRRWDERWRVVLGDDDASAVWSLHKAGYLDRLKRRTSLFRLSEKGKAACPDREPRPADRREIIL